MLRRLRGVVVEPEAFNWDAVPEHLKMGFQVRNARNKILGEGKDLRALQQQLHKRDSQRPRRLARRIRRGHGEDGCARPERHWQLG